MVDSLPPPPQSFPPAGGQTPAPQPAAVDGLARPAPAPVSGKPVLAPQVQRVKRQLVMLACACYLLFIFWCLTLLVILPSPTGDGKSLVRIALPVSIAGIAGILGIGLLLLRRISASTSSIAIRRQSLLKLIAVLLPGLALAVATPILIIREPSLPLDIVAPKTAAEFVAPVAVTLSAERATTILKNLGMRPVKYQWDTDGDGKVNDETVVPTTTVVYQRQGVYPAAVRIMLGGSNFRRSTRSVVIPQEVFSVIPAQPIVEKPVKFSVATLVADPKAISQVQWDFGDGNPAQTTTKPDIAYTYYAVGEYPVTAVMQLVNKSQVTYKKTVVVEEPPPLPFPITLITEPKTLVGPAPFGVIFRLQTAEKLSEVSWTFGDGKEDRGAALLRQSHEFDSAGIYPVVVRARSADGKLAELTSIVRATEVLQLRDLQFTGTPPVLNGKITGEVPLEINLKPKTSAPLVRFSWELPEGTDFDARDASLTGILRTEGTYTVMLMAEGAEGKSMRMSLPIEVKPPSAEPTILMTPDGGVAPLTVTFDASQTFVPPGQTVAGFKWLFGDEGNTNRNPELSAARVEHTYKNPGEYAIQLHVVLASGKEFTVQRTIVVRKPTLSACITASRLTVDAGKGVSFDSSCSAGSPTSALWDVRRDDDPEIVHGQSSEERYIHVFQDPGEYTVTLTLRDSFGNQDVKTIAITVHPAP